MIRPDILIIAPLALIGAIAVACTPAQLQTAIEDGQLFCAKATATGPLVFAVATAFGAPVVVTGALKATVAGVCGLEAAIPVAPPANPAAAPVVAVAITNGALAQAGAAK